RIDAVKPPLQFRRKQTVDLIDWEDEPAHPELDALCRAISAHLGRQSTPHPAPPATLDPQQKPRRSLRLFFWTGVASLILAGSELWYWDAFHRQHVEYYANVIKRWGLPEGVGPLTDEEVRHRSVSLAFQKRGRWGAVHEIQAVDSRGRYPPVFTYFPLVSFVGLNPFANELSEISGLCRVAFMRDADGRVVAQIGYNRSDRPLYTLHYAQPDIAEYKEGAFSKAVRESGITHIKFIRPETGAEAGLDKKLLYFDSGGAPKADESGIFGERATFDAFGQPIEVTYLGADGQPAVGRDGSARVRFTYDGQGSLTQIARFGSHDEPALGSSGSAQVKLLYDRHGNLAERAFFGTDGQLVTKKDMGAAGRTYVYDDHGNPVETTFFGPDRQLVVGFSGFAKQTIVWDDRGGSIESYFGPDGKPVPISGRVIKNRALWDERGYLVEVAGLDENNRSVRSERGCAKITFTYDKHGNVTETACFDEGERPIRDTDGAARVKRVYDERGNKVEESYVGPNGQPGRYEETYVKTRWKYNSQGKEVEEAYFDAEGKPVKKRDGYAKVTYGRDLQGKVIEVVYFDDNGQPTESEDGYARIARTYDVRGNMIEESLFDTQGKPSRGEDGCFKTKYRYDDRGYRIETACYDERDRPALYIEGYARIRDKYSDKGQLVEVALFGLDGSPVVPKKFGFAKARRTYSTRGKLSQISYFDPNDRLVRGANGYATAKTSYDELGRETKREFYDVGGVPVSTRVTIDKVEPDGKAQRVGLQEGDAVLGYDGAEVADTHVFSELELVKGERPRQVTIQRDGRVLSVEVPPGRLTGLETAHKVPAKLAEESGSLQEGRP
ncbi:MAG: hypothetical protein ACREXX_17360, partial [Gammaproteobacteria bacterium]